MAETVEPKSEHAEIQNSKRTDPKSFTRVVLIITTFYGILIAVAIYHPHLNERVKFATENGLSLAILVMQWQSRIAEQSLIAGGTTAEKLRLVIRLIMSATMFSMAKCRTIGSFPISGTKVLLRRTKFLVFSRSHLIVPFVVRFLISPPNSCVMLLMATRK